MNDARSKVVSGQTAEARPQTEVGRHPPRWRETPASPPANAARHVRSSDAATNAVDWAAWRRHFRGLDDVIYLNTSSHGAKSDAVTAALHAYLESWTLDPPWEGAWQDVVRRAEARFARLVGASSRDVVMVPSLTDAFHRAMSAFDHAARPKVVLSAREWVSLRHAVAAWPRVEPVVVDGTIDPDDVRFLSRIDDRTRLVVVSHVCFQTGYRASLGPIAERADAVGARLFVDAFQSAGAVEIDAPLEGVHFLAAGALKYLLGTPGAAFLYVHPDVADGATPGLSGWRGQERPMEPLLAPAAGARRFAVGTWTVPSAFAADAGLSLLEEAGPASIAGRIAALVGLFQAELTARGLYCRTPAEPTARAGIVVVPCRDADAILARLRAASIVAAARGDGLRFSFHAYNTDAEIRAVAEHLEACLGRSAAHDRATSDHPELERSAHAQNGTDRG